MGLHEHFAQLAQQAHAGQHVLGGSDPLSSAAMPLVLSQVRSGSVTSALTIDPTTGAGNIVDLTITGNPTINIGNGFNGQKMTLRLFASGADRTVILGANILEPPGVASSYLIPSGTVLTLEFEWIASRPTPGWLLTRVRNPDVADPVPGFLSARLAADNAGVASTTMTTGLSIPVVPGTYVLDGVVFYNTLGAADIKFDFTVPAGSGRYSVAGLSTAIGTVTEGDVVMLTSTIGGAAIAVGGNGNVVLAAQLAGSFVVTTAGNLVLRYAQNTANATVAKLIAGSWMRAEIL
ncbi:hypothetical protein WY02_03430 [Pseudonocardia sp. AL041005-10]|nr:hypothetical protein [Pseudonocardia sp. AL041005-10]ALE77656.1 hypothetical protein WY02_03430 [Pseudonocardia sp. AL041005-10]